MIKSFIQYLENNDTPPDNLRQKDIPTEYSPRPKPKSSLSDKSTVNDPNWYANLSNDPTWKLAHFYVSNTPENRCLLLKGYDMEDKIALWHALYKIGFKIEAEEFLPSLP